MSAADPLAWSDSAPEGNPAPKVLHVSGDFPDPVNGAKTPVIRRFVDLTKDRFDHRVISLNRSKPKLASSLLPGQLSYSAEPFEYGEAWSYGAPSSGVWHRRKLLQLGDAIAERMRADPPELIVAHKLAIEGLAVARAANLLDRPYAAMIQGNTDLKILTARPDLRRYFKRVFHDAALAMSLAPWSLREVEVRLGKFTGPSLVIPAATELDTIRAPKPDAARFVSLFHLGGYRVKNLAGIIGAIRLLRERGVSVGLDIVGGGDPAVRAHCQRMAAGIEGIRFVGEADRQEVQDVLNDAIAMVLPSRRESFGLAFIEALFAGTPIIYPAGAAVDGYFDNAPFALRAEASDPASIAVAMERAVKQQVDLKAALAEWQHSEGPRRFSSVSVGQAFGDALSLALRA